MTVSGISFNLSHLLDNSRVTLLGVTTGPEPGRHRIAQTPLSMFRRIRICATARGNLSRAVAATPGYSVTFLCSRLRTPVFNQLPSSQDGFHR